MEIRQPPRALSGCRSHDNPSVLFGSPALPTLLAINRNPWLCAALLLVREKHPLGLAFSERAQCAHEYGNSST